jgi:flagellar biosynthetic protein FliR
MLTLGVDSFYSQVNHYLWPTIRVLALFTAAPVLSEKAFNNKAKICLAVCISLLIGQGLPQQDISLFSYLGIWVAVQQIIIGIAMGFSIQLLFVAVRTAGEIVGLQMGLSFATFFDPMNGMNMPIIARFLNLIITLLFLVFNGHLWMISVIFDSFSIFPVSTTHLNAKSFLYFVNNADIIFSYGLRLGMPIVALLLAVNLMLGILNRLTPQLSIFVIGFPLTLLLGMAALVVQMTFISAFFEEGMENIFERLYNFLNMLIS